MSIGRANPPILVIDSGTRSADWLLDWARHRPTDAVAPLIVLEPGADVAETVRRVMDAQLSFYAQVLDFEPADEVEPVELMR